MAAPLSDGGANGVMDCGIVVVCLLASVLWNDSCGRPFRYKDAGYLEGEDNGVFTRC